MTILKNYPSILYFANIPTYMSGSNHAKMVVNIIRRFCRVMDCSSKTVVINQGSHGLVFKDTNAPKQ